MNKQSGVVLVFALVVLLSITILGVSAVSSSVLQSKMASSLERKSVAFAAAESAIAGVVFESEDRNILQNPAVEDPLSEARQGTVLDLANDNLSCFDNNRTRREVTSSGLNANVQHTTGGQFSAQGNVTSWSQTAFVREQPCQGSSNVISGSNLSCHVFVVRGCGQAEGSNYAVANELAASVLAPAAN